jgi:hypothetical protein
MIREDRGGSRMGYPNASFGSTGTHGIHGSVTLIRISLLVSTKYGVRALDDVVESIKDDE